MLKSKTDNSMLRALPSIDSLLKSEVARRLNVQIGAEKLASLARQVTAEIREKVKSKSFTAAKGSTGNNGLLLMHIQDRTLEHRVFEEDAVANAADPIIIPHEFGHAMHFSAVSPQDARRHRSRAQPRRESSDYAAPSQNIPHATGTRAFRFLLSGNPLWRL